MEKRKIRKRTRTNEPLRPFSFCLSTPVFLFVSANSSAFPSFCILCACTGTHFLLVSSMLGIPESTCNQAVRLKSSTGPSVILDLTLFSRLSKSDRSEKGQALSRRGAQREPNGGRVRTASSRETSRLRSARALPRSRAATRRAGPPSRPAQARCTAWGARPASPLGRTGQLSAKKRNAAEGQHAQNKK